jgi:hypothetical protein
MDVTQIKTTEHPIPLGKQSSFHEHKEQKMQIQKHSSHGDLADPKFNILSPKLKPTLTQ